MKEKLKKLLFLLAILSIPASFLAGYEHAFLGWHRLPFMDAIIGGIGAVFLILIIKFVASFTSKKEDFYD
jgi:hypothetical protein